MGKRWRSNWGGGEILKRQSLLQRDRNRGKEEGSGGEDLLRSKPSTRQIGGVQSR